MSPVSAEAPRAVGGLVKACRSISLWACGTCTTTRKRGAKAQGVVVGVVVVSGAGGGVGAVAAAFVVAFVAVTVDVAIAGAVDVVVGVVRPHVLTYHCLHLARGHQKRTRGWVYRQTGNMHQSKLNRRHIRLQTQKTSLLKPRDFLSTKYKHTGPQSAAKRGCARGVSSPVLHHSKLSSLALPGEQ